MKIKINPEVEIIITDKKGECSTACNFNGWNKCRLFNKRVHDYKRLDECVKSQGSQKGGRKADDL